MRDKHGPALLLHVSFGRAETDGISLTLYSGFSVSLPLKKSAMDACRVASSTMTLLLAEEVPLVIVHSGRQRGQA